METREILKHFIELSEENNLNEFDEFISSLNRDELINLQKFSEELKYLCKRKISEKFREYLISDW